jgi:hypothetical protein
VAENWTKNKFKLIWKFHYGPRILFFDQNKINFFFVAFDQNRTVFAKLREIY